MDTFQDCIIILENLEGHDFLVMRKVVVLVDIIVFERVLRKLSFPSFCSYLCG